MKSHARVVIIGGGIAGCSTLYHLTREGWSDVMLVERDELTSGTTWHSAAQVTNFGGVQTMVGLKSHSIKLYKEMADDPEYPIIYHHADGGIRLASTTDHVDGYNHFISMAKGMGVEFEMLDKEECKKRHPLIETHEILGGLWDPLDGYIDPTQLTQALANRARKAGATVSRHNPVHGVSRAANGEWIVHAKKGDITCEIVVNAGGYRVNELGAMMGVEHPVASMEHQYFITDDIPELAELGHRVPLLRDPLDDFYSRQDKNGLLVGIYEQDCKTWGMDGIDPHFTNALCPNDLDRCLSNVERVFMRMPCLEQVGIRTMVNGPITYSIDGLPLVGQIPGQSNAFCIIGLRAGLGEGGGHGKILAELIVHGESEWDTWCLDPRRFTQYANREFTALKAVEDYQNEFRFHMPHEHRPAGRLAKTTPIYETLKNQGAMFHVVNGWERAAFFNPSLTFDENFKEEHSFRFANWHECVQNEVTHLQNHVGIMEVSGFNRYEITCDDSEKLYQSLNHLMCGKVRNRLGKVSLHYFLNQHGNVKGEATLAHLTDNKVWFGSAAAAEYHDMDWLKENMDEDITITSLTNSHTILVVAGPKSRDLLSALSPRTDWSSAKFPWLSCKKVFLGHIEILAMSVSFSGELAWELHIPNEQLYGAYDMLWREGKSHNLRPFGLMAAESMRIEKGYCHWKADLITEFNPLETGLDRFVALDKEAFIGKDALLAQHEKGYRRKLVTMIVDCDDAPMHGGASVMDKDDQVIGTITSASWGYRIGRNIAVAFIDPKYADVGTEVAILNIGKKSKATVTEKGLYDPSNSRIKS